MRRREQLQALHGRVRSTRTGRLTLQIIIGTVGAAVVIVGLILVPLPGPGWLIVLAGLFILAAEFAWASRLLEFTRDRLERWWHWLGRQHWFVRFLAGLSGLVFVTAVTLLTLRTSLGISFGDLWSWFEAH